jgi:RNA polymerase sigma factor (sigma-70 family)
MGRESHSDENVFSSTLDAVRRVARRMLRDPELANDVAQETYLKYLALPSSVTPREPERYLYAIAVNVARHWMRARKQSHVTFDSSLADSNATTQVDERPDGFDHIASKQYLERVLAQIPATYRSVLLMRIRDGKSIEEIAFELKLTPKTVRNYIHRGVKHARDFKRREHRRMTP